MSRKQATGRVKQHLLTHPLEKNIGVGDTFIWFITWSFTSSGISETRLWTVSLEEIFVSCLPHYLLQEVVILFPTNRFHKRFFQSYEVFCLAISSATSYEACLVGGNIRQDKSLTFHTCFMASEEFYNFLWRGSDVLSLNAVWTSKVSYTWQALYHCNTLLPECWLHFITVYCW